MELFNQDWLYGISSDAFGHITNLYVKDLVESEANNNDSLQVTRDQRLKDTALSRAQKALENQSKGIKEALPQDIGGAGGRIFRAAPKKRAYKGKYA
jgi:hypothetical protein